MSEQVDKDLIARLLQAQLPKEDGSMLANPLTPIVGANVQPGRIPEQDEYPAISTVWGNQGPNSEEMGVPATDWQGDLLIMCFTKGYVKGMRMKDAVIKILNRWPDDFDGYKGPIEQTFIIGAAFGHNEILGIDMWSVNIRVNWILP